MLADYETNPLTWTGTLDSWKNVETSDYTRADQLPTDATGWKIFAGKGEAHAGYHSSYYDKNRAVLFDDVAQSDDVSLGESISVPAMRVDNSAVDYKFSRNGFSLSAQDFQKAGTRDAVFENISLSVTGTATVRGAGAVALGENAVLEIGGEEKSYTLERNAKNFGNGKIFDAILNAEKICGAT